MAKFITTVMISTILALGYVHQQTELVKVSYQIKTAEETLAQVLDLNKELVYNINTLKSPGNLERILIAKNIKLQNAAPSHIVYLRVKRATPEMQVARLMDRGKKFFAAIFALNAEAQAKTFK